MTKLAIAKYAVGTIVGYSTSHVVSSIITNQLRPQGLNHKVQTLVGSFVIGSMVGAASKKHIDEQIDALADWWTTNVSAAQK